MSDVTTVTRPTWAVPAIAAKVAELNDRIEAKGLGSPVTFDVSEPRVVTDDLGFDDLVVDITISTAPVALSGDWELVGVLDFATADTPIVHNLADDIDLRAGIVDPLHCDGCGVARHRNRTFAVRSADGAIAIVGSTCVSDFLGIDPAKVLWVVEAVGSIGDDEFSGGSFGSYDIPTVDFVAAARAAVVTAGWVKASDWDRTPTKSFASDIVSGVRPVKGDDLLIEAREVYVDPATRAFAADAIAWASAIDPRSDFDFNLVAVASSATIGSRGYGIAAYLPVAFARFLDGEAAKVAEAKAAEAGEVEPVPTGRVVITGEVIGISERYSDYGVTYKLTVKDDRGFRVWVTRPAAISTADRGDRVSFTATVEPSSDDKFFGFGKRPTKASVLVAA
jgi:hypothetical protein